MPPPAEVTSTIRKYSNLDHPRFQRLNERMRALAFMILILTSQFSTAGDCSAVKPFRKAGSQKVHVSVARLFWVGSVQHDEDVCSVELKVDAYDVRGREDEAYDCLKPRDSEIVSCQSTLDGEAAEITVVPASWLRTWKPQDRREYRFHSYVVKTANPKFYLDIFSRSLSSKLSPQSLILEGALKTGPGNTRDGFYVRAEFKR